MEYPRYTKERRDNVALKNPVSLFVTTKELHRGGINSGVSLLVDETEHVCHVIEWTASIDGGLLYCIVITADIEESIYLFDFTAGGEKVVVWELQVAGVAPADESDTTHDLVFFQPRPVYIPRTKREDE